MKLVCVTKTGSLTLPTILETIRIRKAGSRERKRTLPYQSIIWFAERPMSLLHPSNPQSQSLEPWTHWKKRKQHRLQQIFPTRYGSSSLKSWSGNNTYAGLQRTNECSWDTIQICRISCVRVIRIDSPGDSQLSDLCPLFAKSGRRRR